MIAILRVNIRRIIGDRRLLALATVFPLLFILVTGLLAGSPKEPVGLVNPSPRLLELVQHTAGVKVRIEPNRAALSDDILRGRVVAGLVGLPARPSAIRVDFVSQSATTDAVQARTDVVALLDLIAAEGYLDPRDRHRAGAHPHARAAEPLLLRGARRSRALHGHHRARPLVGPG